MGDTDAKVFLMILTFLMFWTGFVGIVNLASSGEITLSTIGSVLGSPASQTSVPGQLVMDPGNNAAANSLIYEQNYSSGNFDQNLTFGISDWRISYGEWTAGPTGYVLTDPNPSSLQHTPYPALFLDNIIPDSNGVYTVDYRIDNIPDTTFYIYPKYSRSDPAHTIQIAFAPEGIHVYNQLWIGTGVDGTKTELAFIPAAGVQTTAPGGSVFTTKLDSKQNLLTIQKDGGEVYSVSGTIVPGSIFTQSFYYGAVGSNDAGFTLQGTMASRSYSTAASGSNTPWGWAVKLVENTIPGATAVIQMLAIIGAAVGLTSQPVVPFAVWAALGIPAIITLLYLGAKLARGS